MIIVGCGGSLFRKKRGKEIDNYSIVIRILNIPSYDIKDHANYDIKDQGKKTDYLVASTKDSHLVNIIPNLETWVGCRPNELTKEIIERTYKRLINHNIVFFNENTDYWLNRYIENGAKTGKLGLRPIPQTGTIGIIVTITRLKPKKLTLTGFDSLWEKDKLFRGYHDLVAERKLINEVSEMYGTELVKF